MLKWEPDVVSGIIAYTPFCQLSIYRQQASKERYAVQIRGARGGRVVASTLDLPSEEVGKIWSTEKYRALLMAELAGLE